MVFRGIFGQADYYRYRSGRGSLWSDGTAARILWILMEFDLEDEFLIYADTDSIKVSNERRVKNYDRR